METRIGQLLFVVALLAAIIFAAPYTTWDALQIEVEPVLEAGPAGPVLVQPFSAPALSSDKNGDVKQAAELRDHTERLMRSLGRKTWPYKLTVDVMDRIETKGEGKKKKTSVVGTDVRFNLIDARGPQASVTLPLEVDAAPRAKPADLPRTHLSSTVNLLATGGPGPFTFDETLAHALTRTLSELRRGSGAPLLYTHVARPHGMTRPSRCDPTSSVAGLYGAKCVQTICPATDTTLCPYEWESVAFPPAAAPDLPLDETAAFKWKLAKALHVTFGDVAETVIGDESPLPVRGDYAPTRATGVLREELNKRKTLPAPNEKLALIATGTVVGVDRAATLDLNIRPAMPASGEPAKLKVNVNKDFPSTDVSFWIAALVALAGVILWRVGKRKEAQASAAAMANSDSMEGNPFALLREVLPPARAFAGEIGGLDEHAIMDRTDELLTRYILPFGDVRTKVTETLGMGLGAEILVVVAYGERMMNRVWTAASDGHPTEARNCFPEALNALEKAHKLVEGGTGASAGAPTAAGKE